MEFTPISNERTVQLDVEELERIGYKLPCRVWFALSGGAVPWFKLVTHITSRDISFGWMIITEEGIVKIPRKLKAYTKARIAYGSAYVHMELE